MEDVGEQHPYCVMCIVARLAGLSDWHEDCTGRDGTRWCACDCPWLTGGDDSESLAFGR